MKNRDDHCLRWALRVALAYPPPPYHPERPRWYPTEDGLNFQRIDAPTPISQIPKVEKLNNLAISVFGWDKGVHVYRLSTQPHGMPRINLLLIEKAGKFHYIWIKDLNRLLRDQSKHKERKHFCERCLHGYTREDLLEAHRPDCRGIGQTAVRVEMPEKGKNKVFFQNHHKQLPVPFIIYADFEALTTLAGSCSRCCADGVLFQKLAMGWCSKSWGGVSKSCPRIPTARWGGVPKVGVFQKVVPEFPLCILLASSSNTVYKIF